jgi:hypothetical protein
MLPQAPATMRRIAALLVGAWLAAAAGCGARETPEAQVRALVAAGERAAEARDVGGMMELVAPRFEDAQGGGREELARLLRGYFVIHQSVHLLTRVEQVEFPYRDYARVRLTVGALGRETAGATAFDVAADVHEVVLELRLEDDAWRVVRAGWRSSRRGG